MVNPSSAKGLGSGAQLGEHLLQASVHTLCRMFFAIKISLLNPDPISQDVSAVPLLIPLIVILHIFCNGVRK